MWFVHYSINEGSHSLLRGQEVQPLAEQVICSPERSGHTQRTSFNGALNETSDKTFKQKLQNSIRMRDLNNKYESNLRIRNLWSSLLNHCQPL